MSDKPRIESCQPAFKISGYDQAVAHYVDWLGFNLDWEWRAEPDAPVIISVSRDNLSLFLNEEEAAEGVWLRVSVVGLEQLVAEWNKRRPEAVELILEQPYEIPTAYIADPFGNGLALQELQTDAIREARQQQVQAALEYLQASFSDASDLPTSEALAEFCGCSSGVVSQALGAFLNDG